MLRPEPIDAELETGAAPSPPRPVGAVETFAEAKQRAIDRFEREYLEALMRRADGNISRAAREAGLARHHLRDLLRKHELYTKALNGRSNSAPPSSPTTDE